MTKVRNNKSANVGIPAGGQTIIFKPGVHEYAAELLNKIDTSRKAVRAYLEPQGKNPAVLEMVDGLDTEPPPSAETAAELVALVRTSSDIDWLEAVRNNDERKTVHSAAEKRLSELRVDPPEDEPPEDDETDPGAESPTE